jgi:hypothetical protein
VVARHKATLSHELDDGDVTAHAVHIGDGYYDATFKCRECGEDATKQLTVDERTFDAQWAVWAQEHWHNP